MATPDYPAGEALLLVQVKAATGYGESNVSRGDWSFLNRENIVTGAVIRPGPFALSYGEARVDATWRAKIEVWRKYTDDGVALLKLEADVKAIIARLILYPHMQDTTNTISQAAVMGGGEIMRIPPAPQGPHWLMQELDVEWLEQSPVTYSE